MNSANMLYNITKKSKTTHTETFENLITIVEHHIHIAASRGFSEIEFNINKESTEINKKLAVFLESKGYVVDHIWSRYFSISWQFAKDTPKDSLLKCNKYLLQSYSGLPLAT